MDIKIGDLDIENVVLYIGDAVRYEDLHPKIDCQGVTAKTVSQSIHTPPSFSSIFTGCIPPRHGVYWFSETLPESLPTLLTVDNHVTHFAHTNTALERSDGGLLANVLRAGDASSQHLGTIPKPFIWTERGPGGHAPYGSELKIDTGPYFDKILPASEDVLKQEYKQAIERDYKNFQRRLETLEERGLRDKTLVIYASDHGEMLGENGMVGHNEPITSELVYTPTVFIHPDLDDQDGGVMRNIDLYPTIRDVLGYDPLEHVDGKSIVDLSKPVRGTVHYNHAFDVTRRYGEKYTQLERFMPVFDQHAVFDSAGGRARRFNSNLDQLMILTGNIAISTVRSQYRRHPLTVSKKYLRRKWTCGSPRFSWEEADGLISSAREQELIGSRKRVDVDEEHLEALGYV